MRKEPSETREVPTVGSSSHKQRGEDWTPHLAPKCWSLVTWLETKISERLAAGKNIASAMVSGSWRCSCSNSGQQDPSVAVRGHCYLPSEKATLE